MLEDTSSELDSSGMEVAASSWVLDARTMRVSYRHAIKPKRNANMVEGIFGATLFRGHNQNQRMMNGATHSTSPIPRLSQVLGLTLGLLAYNVVKVIPALKEIGIQVSPVRTTWVLDEQSLKIPARQRV